jgi:hypothetical protein
MELASQDSIRQLLPGCGNPGRVRVHGDVRHYSEPVNKGRKMRCKCGRCQQCLDDARWERIFAEKFADPTYYNRPLTRLKSPLASM